MSSEIGHYMEAVSRMRPALQELLDWTSRMPDALFGPDDPRWDWWAEGALIRQQARNALSGEHNTGTNPDANS